MLLFLTAQTVPQYTTFIYVFAALVGGGALNIAYKLYLRYTRGPIEDKQIIGQIVQGEVSGMKDLLAEYRVEVEVTKRQLEEYREQLGQVTRDLAKAQVQISRLEDDLRTARADRDKRMAELAALITERDRLSSERETLAAEANELRARVTALERFAHTAHPEMGDERPG